MKRFIALLLCAVTLLSTLAVFTGCGSKDDEDKGQYITAYLTSNVYDFDPVNAYKNESVAAVVGLMFDTLFKLDENGKVKKSLVDDYTITENKANGEYKMTLRLKDTKWSDGTAISANDIVFAWQRLLRVDSDYEAASLLFDIKNARAAKEGEASIDDVGIYPAEEQLLEINFEGPTDYDQFMLNLTSLALAPLRDEIVSKSDDWAKKASTIVCSGPFKLGRINYTTTSTTYYDPTHVEFDKDNGVPKPSDPTKFDRNEQLVVDFVMERNTYYFRDAEEDKLDKTVTPYKICVDCSLTDEQLVEMYDKGIIQYVGDIPLSLRTDSSIAKNAIVSERSLSTNSIYLNQNAIIDNGKDGEALFANADVRRALSMAIDREAIAEAVVYAEAATGLLPSGVFEAGNRKKTFRDACTASYYALKTDTTAAKALLDQAGIKPSSYTFTLQVAAYDEVHCVIADMIVASWQELGFNVTVEKIGTITNNDWYQYTEDVPSDICDDLYAERLQRGDFEAILLDVVAYSPDAFTMLAPYAKAFSGRAMDMSDSENYILPTHITGYDSEAYNTLMESIYDERTVSARADMLREAESILMNDVPVIPVIFNKQAVAVGDKLSMGVLFKDLNINYYNVVNFQKCKISSYNKYLAAGQQYITDNFDALQFNDYDGCAYAKFEPFKSATTIYSQFFPDED